MFVANRNGRLIRNEQHINHGEKRGRKEI